MEGDRGRRSGRQAVHLAPVVVAADAVVQPAAVVVKVAHTLVARAAVLRPPADLCAARAKGERAERRQQQREREGGQREREEEQNSAASNDGEGGAMKEGNVTSTAKVKEGAEVSTAERRRAK